ncbi:MAG: sigma-54 dependent transcriptional regulator [Porticoccaceae bacterium]|nr:sigma-54 dependent transcriptional regulator [Porticoccaceae bacterium]MDG1307836.1 sigma-54 dependent transcriptional regulator [Porticoccaceae bacterium]
MSKLSSIVGSSREINELRALIQIVGPSDSTVLILGDSGTGKELVANALHGCSQRAGAPFIPVNCGAIPRELLESELFGHRKGSFTGAISDRKGRFELANGGTLFLDEIGDMSMDLQVKLLRVLQERTIDPVGSTQSMDIDVRVVAATHKNIEQLVQEGGFREDLFYRLNVMPMQIEALQDRREDIPVLFEHFANHYAKAGQPPITMASGSMQLLLQYHWPGNVRELSNLVDRYTALYPGQQVDLRKVPSSMIPSGIRTVTDNNSADALAALMTGLNTVDSHDQPNTQPQAASIDEPSATAADEPVDEVQRVIMLAQGGGSFPEQGMQLKQHLLEIERSLIKQALGRAEGNVSKTARLLNLQRTTLIEKINKYGLSEGP